MLSNILILLDARCVVIIMLFFNQMVNNLMLLFYVNSIY